LIFKNLKARLDQYTKDLKQMISQIETRIVTLGTGRVSLYDSNTTLSQEYKEVKRNLLRKSVQRLTNLDFEVRQGGFLNETDYLGENYLGNSTQASQTRTLQESQNLQDFYSCFASIECEIKALLVENPFDEKSFQEIDYNDFREEFLLSVNLKKQLVSSLKHQVKSLTSKLLSE
jgi:hypothetical protein